MVKRLVLWVFVLSVLAIVGLVGARQITIGKVPEHQPVLQKSQELVVRGRLEPMGGVIDVGAASQFVSPTLGALFVAEGQEVNKGDILATLSTATALQAEVSAAEAEVRVANRQLEDVLRPYKSSEVAAAQAALEAQRVEEKLAASQVARNAELPEGIRSALEQERDAGAFSLAAAQRAKAEAALAMVKQHSETKAAIAKAQVDLAKARLLAKQAEAALTVIRAPASGRVLRILVAPGELVNGSPIMQIADMDRLKVIAEVDERLIDRIALKDSAEVSVPRGQRRWLAHVSRVGNIVVAVDRPSSEAITGRAGRVTEVELTLVKGAELPEVAGLELSIRFIRGAEMP